MVISKQDNAIMRGFAILLIILHNFCHWMPHCVEANEFTWSYNNIVIYLNYISHGGPHLFLNFLSHYGHYGIALFLLLSGYGLSQKYDKQTNLNSFAFLLNHAKKLLWLLLPALFISFIVDDSLWLSQTWKSLIQLCTFTANLNPYYHFIYGPWWWFSLIMQFYVIYAFIFHNHSIKFITLFTSVILIFYIGVTCYCWNDLDNNNSLMAYLHYNFPCSILPFYLGVLLSRIKYRFSSINWLFIVCLSIIVGGSFSAIVWCIAPLFAAIALLIVGKFLSKLCFVNYLLQKVGKISAWIFAIHPIVRKFAIPYIDVYNDYLVLIIYILITIAVAWLINKLINKVKDMFFLFF